MHPGRIPAPERLNPFMEVNLKLADCRIHISEKTNYPVIFWPDEPWDLFECRSEKVPDIDIDVTIEKKLPEFNHQELLFDSNHGVWKLYEAGENYYFESLHTKRLTPFCRASISKDLSRVRASMLPTRHQGKLGWSPAQIINPIGEFCLLTWLARRGAFMLHASGVVMPSGAWVFCGQSGAGKTTLAQFFSEAALTRLSDETILIRQTEKGFMAYGTPWLGEGHIAANEKAPLRHLYFIRHGKEKHAIRQLQFSELSVAFFQQAFLPHWDKAAMEKTAATFQSMIEQGLCSELAPLKNPDVVDFLIEHEKALI